MKIVVLDGWAVDAGQLPWDWLSEFGETEKYDRTDADDVIERIGDADTVLVNKCHIGEAEFSACPNLKLICQLATGYNNIDCVAARAHGVTVSNVPNYSTDSVAQHVFALLLEICVHVGEYSASVRSGDWACCEDYTYMLAPITELAGKTFGVVGYGSIGRRVGDIARAFGMNVIYSSRTEKKLREGEIARRVPLDTLLCESDVVSLHTPLTAETSGMINAEAIAKMKPTAILINTSRGPVVDENALAAALNAGKLAGAGLDVLSNEPPRGENDAIITAKNAIVTPHIAWAPLESRRRLVAVVRGNMKAYLAGSPTNVVN
ncbi:MAG: D-2-hydroxyacid dehydrogenase [Oscillospiraceae bacterium]